MMSFSIFVSGLANELKLKDRNDYNNYAEGGLERLDKQALTAPLRRNEFKDA